MARFFGLMARQFTTCALGVLMMIRFAALCGLALTVLAGCSALEDDEPHVTVARWDHKAQGPEWTSTVMEALEGPGAPMVALVPGDIDTWCPGYTTASLEERKAFWVGLLSALAKHESTWQPHVSGGNGRWHGLLQISPGTARGYGCEARSASALKDGSANLRCAVRIMGVTVPRDGVISEGMRGIAADWGPFHQRSKRTEMAAWTRSLPYCQAGGA